MEISILTPKPRKKQRHNFTVKAKSEVVLKQKGRCAICGTHMNSWERDFHHKDRNKTNDKPSNCQAVHTRCHRRKHAEEVHNKNDKSWFNKTVEWWTL